MMGDKPMRKAASALVAAFVLQFAHARADTLAVEIAVDAAAGRHPISPLIYGVNFGSAAVLHDLRAPITRSGGNNASSYNWRLDARNTDADWFYESLPCPPDDATAQFGSRFIATARKSGAIPMVTIPMIGWTAKLGPNHTRLASFSIAKYGPQQAHDAQWFPDAGNGRAPDGTPIAHADPHDAETPDTPANEHARVRQLAAGFTRRDIRYYILDNEPSLWHITHYDVHPIGAHAQEIADRSILYSRAIKSADPHGLVVGPEEWGWTGYQYSGFDQQYDTQHGLAHPPDRENQTQGQDYVPWLLTRWKAAGHPIDVFSLHFYPQGGEFSDSDSPTVARARNRSTRDLWDRHYKDPTWINSVIALIPLMRQWVDRYYYPGTPIALTEYNWGGEKLMNGATAQADLLGIFGRERLDIALRWTAPQPGTPVYKAMKLYRNYDDRGDGFGETSIQAAVPDADRVSAFAALRARDGATTVMVINKQLDSMADVSLSLAHQSDTGTVETWQLADNRIVHLAPSRYTNARLHASLPRQSVTLFLLHPTGKRSPGTQPRR
ncbi:cellulase [Gluconacetobacter sp. 1c LMG 22058]|uniref:Cellulase n=2 Tax=Gluconacetobacter dulcium TaxID=2729096 RepID=A0A7W4K067_9PROT|nr:cellulase [Gluconacetobacter dulcium]